MKFSALIFATLFSVCANANEPQWSFGLGVGPNITDLDAVGDELKSSVGAAVWASRTWGEMSRMDISLDYFSFSESGQNYPSFNLAYGLRFAPKARLNPFLLGGVGVGQANNFPRSQKAHQNVFNLFARGGIENIFMGERWNIGLIVDFEYLFMDGKSITSAQLALPMVTFTWRTEGKKHEEAPKPVVAKYQPPPRIDSDGDGVYDDKDECPDTPPGVRVNSIGCKPKQIVTKTLKVEFETDKAIVRPSFMEELDEFGKFMQENADLIVAIEGHTDSVGSRAYNIKLSDARAKSVRQMLIERWNLEPHRLTARGYGPDKPVADNASAEGRQLNRRVNAVLQSR